MLQAYSIFDKKAVSFSKPFFFNHVAEATRSISTLVADGKSQIALFPADFALYLVGTFEEQTGSWMAPSHGAPQFTIEIAALVPQNGVLNGKEA